jgi:hypothetical protein
VMYQGSVYRPPTGMDTRRPTITPATELTPPGIPYHADDDTPCDSPGPCSHFRLVYWRTLPFQY